MMTPPILVVDDSKNDLGLTQRALLMAGILNPVFLFSSAAECLRYFNAEGEFKDRRVPCIGLIDLIMAPLTGVDLFELLKELPAAKGSVLIMLSGLAEYRMIQRGYAAGAATFFVKPVSSEEILRTLSNVSRLKLTKKPNGYELSISGAVPEASSLPDTAGPRTPGMAAEN